MRVGPVEDWMAWIVKEVGGEVSRSVAALLRLPGRAGRRCGGFRSGVGGE